LFLTLREVKIISIALIYEDSPQNSSPFITNSRKQQASIHIAGDWVGFNNRWLVDNCFLAKRFRETHAFAVS